MIHYIYKIIFLRGYPTGRYYLGKRTYRGKDLNNDKYHGSGLFCRDYFKKYGVVLGDTYLKEIIEINPSKDINKLREEIIIGDLWEKDPLCMNMCPGGGVLPKNDRGVIQYDKYGNFINEYSSISEASEAVGLKNPGCISSVCLKKRQTLAANCIWRFSNDPLTEQEYKNINLRRRAVNQYTKDGIFIKRWDSIKDAENELGIDGSSIIDVCKQRTKIRHTAGGFVWSYYNEPFINTSLDNVPNGVKIDQYSKDGVFIKTYKSLREAGISTNMPWQNIQCCCNGRTKYAKGYIWKYHGENVTKEDLNYVRKKLRKTAQCDTSGKIIKIFENDTAAAKALNFTQSKISFAIRNNKKYKGFYWKKVDDVTEN